MVQQLVEFPLQDGGTVVVQVEDGHGGGGRVTRGCGDQEPPRVVEQARQTFEQAVGRVQPAVQALLGQLRTLAEAPEEVQVEFGLQLSAEVGAFVAGASSTGNFTVSMTWHRQPRSDGPWSHSSGRPGEAPCHSAPRVDVGLLVGPGDDDSYRARVLDPPVPPAAGSTSTPPGGLDGAAVNAPARSDR